MIFRYLHGVFCLSWFYLLKISHKLQNEGLKTEENKRIFFDTGLASVTRHLGIKAMLKLNFHFII